MQNKENLLEKIDWAELKKTEVEKKSKFRKSKRFAEERKNCTKKIFVFSRMKDTRRNQAGFRDVNGAGLDFFTIKRLLSSDEIWVDDSSEFENFE